MTESDQYDVDPCGLGILGVSGLDLQAPGTGALLTALLAGIGGLVGTQAPGTGALLIAATFAIRSTR